jgi:hypothetical protein
MLHVCVERFDVMGGKENILGWHARQFRKRSHWQPLSDMAAARRLPARPDK